jgi:hypothetical protein
MVAQDGSRDEAMKLYLDAFFRGCYSPRLAVVVFLQIFMDAARYRRLADAAISWLHIGLREPAEKAPIPTLKKA